MVLGPRPQLSFDSFGHGGRVENLKRGDQLEDFMAHGSPLGLCRFVLLWDLNLVDLNDAQTSSDKNKQSVKVYCTYVYSMFIVHVYYVCLYEGPKVFKECEV